MARKLFPFFLLGLVLSLSLSPIRAAEKVNIGTPIKVYPVYYLLFGAAEEKGYWKESGIDPEWVPFTGSPSLHRALVARSVMTGIETATGSVLAVTRGLPIIIAGLVQYRHEFPLWVRADSPIRSAEDLKKGVKVKVGVAALGGVEDIYTRAIAKALGIQKDIRIVATGAPVVSVAALKSGAVEAVLTSVSTMIRSKLAGDVRSVLSNEDYLPKEWLGHVFYAHTDLLRDSPETVGRLIKALIKASNFVMDNPEWAVKRVIKEHGLPEEGARALHQSFSYSRDGKMEPRRLENIRNFLIEYDQISKEKAPPVEQMFTRQFTR